MKLNILHQTEHFRGDHAADVALAVEPREGETIEELVARTLGCEKNKMRRVAWLEVRLIDAGGC